MNLRFPSVWIARSTLLVGLSAMALCHQSAPGTETDGKVGQFITVRAPITPGEVSRVQRAAKQVLKEHLSEGRRPTLIFQIEPGVSEYHRCAELADFIRKDMAGAERTVAYVAEPLTGHAVMIALACDELVMHPDASIGDIGRDGRIDVKWRLVYSDLARDRRWPEALVLGMLDRDLEVVEIPGNPPRYELARDLPKLREQGLVAGDPATIKRAGAALQFNGMECRNLGLAKLLARDRAAVAEQYRLPAESIREKTTLGQEPLAVVIKVEGIIDPVLAGVISRGIDRARSQGKNLIIFSIDSRDGHLDSSDDIANKVLDLQDVRSVAYIRDKGVSGASFLALACDEIYLHPRATVGDASPVELRDAPDERIASVAQRLGAIAKTKGRPPALAEAMIDRNLVVYEARNTQSGEVRYLSEQDIQNSENPQQWEKAKLVTQQDRPLTLTGADAEALGLSDGVIESDQALWEHLGLESAPPTIGRTSVDTIVFLLNTRAAGFLLILLGVTFLYVELNIPGITVAGIASFLCFLLFFWSHILGGTAGWLEIVLFLAGIGFIGLEIFVIPGFGVTGVSGILLVLASIVLASQTFVWPQFTYQWESLIRSSATTLGALATFVVLAIVISRFLPSLPLFSSIVLRPPTADEIAPATATAAVAAPSGAAPEIERLLIGLEGVATTDLRPAGKARFRDEFLDVVAEGSFVAEGSRIQVVEVTGNRVVVKQA